VTAARARDRVTRRAAFACGAVIATFAAATTAAAQQGRTPPPVEPAAARVALDRALDWLLRDQNPDGSFATGVMDGMTEDVFSIETFYAWQQAAHALACLALIESPATPARDSALQRGMRWLATSRIVKRGNEWDNDAVWAHLYGTVVCVRASREPRVGEALRGLVEARGRDHLAALHRNQVPTGGFGYYDDPPFSRRPKWGTSFCTALVLPALREAEELGWTEDTRVRERAAEYVRRCAVPGDAYEYDLNPIPRISGGEHINRTKGSLGRTQVCNWALATIGDPFVDVARVRSGLDAFFTHQRFLAVARMKPVPHESWYQNAGYFYCFGHYYAALAIELLPAEEREARHQILRRHIVDVQRADGSVMEFLGSRYIVVASTAFAALTLATGLR
jgi:hypothetical protein